MNRILVLTLSLLLLVNIGAAPKGLYFSATRWDFGTVTRAHTIQKTITIRNGTGREMKLTITGTCDCVWVNRRNIRLKAGEKIKVIISYNPADDLGKVEKYVIIDTHCKDMERAVFLIRGTVLAK